MLSEDDLVGVRKLIEAFKPPISFFEKEVLLPGVLGRLNYVKDIFSEFQVIATRPGVAVQIDAAVRSVMDPQLFQAGAPEPRVGQLYLEQVSAVIGTDFIGPIDTILNEATANPPAQSPELFSKFLNSTAQVMQMIVGTKEMPFTYSLRRIVNIRNTTTGEVLVKAPDELSVILAPFQTRIDELVNVAQKTIESIEKWSEQNLAQKKIHVETIVNLTSVKASEQQARAAKYNLWFQVAVIIFAIVLVWAGQKGNLFFENNDLRGAVERMRLQVNDCEAAKEIQKTAINELTNKAVPQCRPVDPTAK